MTFRALNSDLSAGQFRHVALSRKVRLPAHGDKFGASIASEVFGLGTKSLRNPLAAAGVFFF